MASSGYHELQSRLYEDMPRFLSRKNIVIMICRDGRYRSVANAEIWSNTLTRYGQSRHSVSLLHLAELDFWKNTCEGKCPGCIKETTRTFQIHYDCSLAECSRLASSSYSETEHRKRTRQETLGQSPSWKNEFEDNQRSDQARKTKHRVWTPWQNDSRDSTKTLEHLPVVHTRKTSVVKQIRA